MTKFWCRVHSDLFDDQIANRKLRWLEANEHKKSYWTQRLSLSAIKQMGGRKMYAPETEDIAKWMIRERTVEAKEKSICFNPRAFCWDSGKSLFLKPATVVNTLVTGPGDPLEETFYFEPKRYTAWLLKQ